MAEGAVQPSTSGIDLATVSAVAELVINLSIAQRSLLMYGATHPMARRNASQVRDALRHALELEDPVTLHFTAQAVFCGPTCLERNHPIFRSFAERMWRCGVACLSFTGGAGEEEVTGLVAAIGEATRRHSTREEAERILAAAGGDHLRVVFLRQLLTFTTGDGEPLPGPQENLWEDLMRQVAAAAVLAPSAVPTGVAPAAGAGGEVEAPHDYADAVIGYMKQLRRVEQHQTALQETSLGRKVNDLLSRINPELQHQLMATALAAPEVTPELLQRLVHVVGQDQLVDSLRRLNESGQAMPASTLRTLSMFAALGPVGLELPGGGAGAASPVSQRTPEEMEALLDRLLSDEQAARYMTPVHEQVVTTTGRRAQAGTLRPAAGAHRFALPFSEGERHYLLVAAELLADAAANADPGEARELAAAVCRESQRSFVSLVEQRSLGACRQAMRLAESARPLAGEAATAELVWHGEAVLAPLCEQLAAGDRPTAEAAGELLVLIGERAIPLLLEVLATSDSISARRRAIEALVAIEPSPSSRLLALLAGDHPWYLQRNAAHVLRRRRDPAGLPAARALWPRADPRLRLELLRYLVELADPAGPELVRAAIVDRAPEVAQLAARYAVEAGDDENLDAVIRCAEQTPPLEVGNEIHLDLLRLLVRARNPRGRDYVANLAGRRRPLLPWLRDAFRRDLDRLLREVR